MSAIPEMRIEQLFGPGSSNNDLTGERLERPEPMTRTQYFQQDDLVYARYQALAGSGQREVFIIRKGLAAIIDSHINAPASTGLAFGEGYASIHFALSAGGKFSHEQGDTRTLRSQNCLLTRYDAAPIIYRSDHARKMSYIMLAFSPSVLTRELGLSSATLPSGMELLLQPDIEHYKSSCIAMNPSIRYAMEDVFEYTQTSLHMRQIYLRAKLTELLCYLAGDCDTKNGLAGKPGIKLRSDEIARLNDVRQLIEQRIAEPPSLQQLCEVAHCNEKKLTAGFKHLFGASTHQYGLDLRLREARRLLRTGEHSVSEVSEMVGYHQIQSFSRMYRSRYGVAPSKI